jgi:hypothetical protein
MSKLLKNDIKKINKIGKNNFCPESFFFDFFPNFPNIHGRRALL